jgi:hypothetical protein
MIDAKINGIDCKLFYDERVPVDKAPIGFPYIYHLRHDEENWCCPMSIENFVLANFFGTIFTKEFLNIGKVDYIDITGFEVDWDYIEFKFPLGIFGKSFLPDK